MSHDYGWTQSLYYFFQKGNHLFLSKNKQHEFTFKKLAHRTYAIAVFHDLNSNGKLDKNALGLPQEPYGFSNNARNTFSAPSFSQASFVHGEEQSISISVR